MRGHRVLPQDPAEAGADLARPDPPVAQLPDRRIAVDAVAASHQAAVVGGHEGSSRDVVRTEGELVPARLDECLVVAPESLGGECQVAPPRDSPLLASSRILPPDTGVQVDPAVLPLHLINLLTLVGEAKRAGWARSLWLAQAGTGGDIVFLVVPATGCDADVAATLGTGWTTLTSPRTTASRSTVSWWRWSL